MLSAVRRYKSMLSSALARCFPRTTAYLQAEREAREALLQPAKARSRKNAAKAPAKATGKPAKGAGKPAAASRRAPQGIYPAAALKVDESQERAMREQVAQAATLGVVSPPSEEQWAMILCRQPLARIFAGAGSGKSTTLVLRVVFMLCHLGVEPQRLTVISFTNASCAQLREQLLRVLAHWQYPFDAAQARQCVRTFHSALGGLAREVLGNPRWFRTTGRPRPRRRAGQPPCRRTPASGPAAPAEAGLPAVLRGKPGVPRQDPQTAGTAAAGGAGRGRAAAAEGAAGAVQAGRRVPGAAAVRSLPCPGRVRREPGPARRTPGQRQAGMRVAREDLRRSHGTVLGEVPGTVARGGPDDLRRRVPAARRADGRRGSWRKRHWRRSPIC